MQSSTTIRPWATWGIAWGLGLLLVLTVGLVLPGLALIVLTVTHVTTLAQVTQGWGWVASAAASEVAFGVAGAVAWIVATRHYGFGARWRWGLWLKGLGLGLVVGAAFSVIGVLLQQWRGVAIPSDSADVVGPVGVHTGPMIAMLIVIAVLAPFMEEAFFRGTLQTTLAGALGSSGAIAIVAVLFAVAHELDSGHPLAQPWLWVPILPLGIILGIVRTRTGRMAGNIGIHMGFNTWAALVMAIQFWH